MSPEGILMATLLLLNCFEERTITVTWYSTGMASDCGKKVDNQWRRCWAIIWGRDIYFGYICRFVMRLDSWANLVLTFHIWLRNIYGKVF